MSLVITSHSSSLLIFTDVYILVSIFNENPLSFNHIHFSFLIINKINVNNHFR